MMWACLTLIRSWFAAGCPRGSRSIGMYESYAAVMGGILEHLDAGSYPADEMLLEATEDMQSEAEGWFVSGWWAEYRSQSVQVGKTD
jgi:putative DNA primase/helicase